MICLSRLLPSVAVTRDTWHTMLTRYCSTQWSPRASLTAPLPRTTSRDSGQGDATHVTSGAKTGPAEGVSDEVVMRLHH